MLAQTFFIDPLRTCLKVWHVVLRTQKPGGEHMGSAVNIESFLYYEMQR